MHSIELDLKPSKQFIALLTFILCLSFYATVCLPLSVWLKVVLFAIIASYGAYLLLKYGFLSAKQSVMRVGLQSNGTWLLFTQNQVLAGELCGDSTVTRLLVILRFSMAESKLKRSCIIFKDALDPAVYRNLLVILRCQ